MRFLPFFNEKNPPIEIDRKIERKDCCSLAKIQSKEYSKMNIEPNEHKLNEQ
jgi:hypothetical protein